MISVDLDFSCLIYDRIALILPAFMILIYAYVMFVQFLFDYLRLTSSFFGHDLEILFEA